MGGGYGPPDDEGNGTVVVAEWTPHSVADSSSDTGPCGSVAWKEAGRLTVAVAPDTPCTPTIVGACPWTTRLIVRSSPARRLVTVSCLTFVQGTYLSSEGPIVGGSTVNVALGPGLWCLHRVKNCCTVSALWPAINGGRSIRM